MRVTQEHADAISEILKIADNHPPKCHCCVTKLPRAPRVTLGSIFRPVLDLLENNKQRSAVSGSSSSRAAMAYTPTFNNTSGASSSNVLSNAGLSSASGVSMNKNGNAGSNTTQTQRCGPMAPSLTTQPAPTRIIFGVQGLRKSLEIEQIEICNQMNDQLFFPELKKRYQETSSNGFKMVFALSISLLRFRKSKAPSSYYLLALRNITGLIFFPTKFRKISVNRVFFSCEGLPEDVVFANEYEYDPKPPLGKIPLIEPDVFAACLQSCDDGCKWSVLGPWLHDCFQLQPDKERITCIPKKRKEFAVKSKHDAENLVWGIQPGYAVSLVMISIYTLVPLLSAFGFWIYWLARHPGDWQNASVPMVTGVTLETLLLSLLVLSSRSHLRDERR